MSYHWTSIIGLIISFLPLSLVNAHEIDKLLIKQKSNSVLISQNTSGERKVTIEIKVSESKSSGESWDIDRSVIDIAPQSGSVIKSIYEKPDIAICIKNESSSMACLTDKVNPEITVSCQDSYSCIFDDIFIPSGQSKLVIVDLDAFEHDIIGEGYCEINSECQLGRAKIKLSATSQNNDWSEIVNFLSEYYNRNQNNPKVAGFAQQMLIIAQKSSNQPWAGEFTRSSFINAVDDIKNHSNFWSSPEYRSGWDEVSSKWCRKISGYESTQQSQARYDCGFMISGNHHLDRHIKPGFNKYAEKVFRSAISNSNSNNLIENIISSVEQIRQEHNQFLKQAIEPGIRKNQYISWSLKKIGVNLVPLKAVCVREEAFLNALAKLEREGLISNINSQEIQRRIKSSYKQKEDINTNFIQTSPNRENNSNESLREPLWGEPEDNTNQPLKEPLWGEPETNESSPPGEPIF
jgi:hypothetical protein